MIQNDDLQVTFDFVLIYNHVNCIAISICLMWMKRLLNYPGLHQFKYISVFKET